MDINFRLFSERLGRVLAGEEVTLPDAAKQPIQNLHAEVEIVTSWLSEFEDDISCLLMQKIGEVEIDNPDLGTVMDEINCFTYESEKFIDTFINSITQQKRQSRRSKDICDALLGLQSKIIDIKQRMQQVQHFDSGIIDEVKSIEAEAGNFLASSSSKNRDTVGLDDRMEDLLDLLIEGPHQLLAVAILDSIGLDKTAFVAEAYSSNYVKHYFDCHAWVPEPHSYDAHRILDIIIKFLMPSSRLTWDVIRKILPDNQNGSRVLITLAQIKIVTSFQFENGENIGLDFVPTGGLLRATYQGWPFHILYHGSISLEENIDKVLTMSLGLQCIIYCMSPFCLKPCFLYFSVFPAHLEISTRHVYQLWIAEGFIEDNNEATAKKYLEQLINRGFVEANKRRAGGTINTCSIPGRCRPVLLGVASKVEFIFSPFMDIEGEIRAKMSRPNPDLARYCPLYAHTPQEQIRAGLVKAQSEQYLAMSGLGLDIMVSEWLRVSTCAMVGQTSARTLSPQGGVAAPRVLLSDGGANLGEDAESPRGCVCNTLGESHIDKARERYWVYKGSGLGLDIMVSKRLRMSSQAMVGQTSARTLSPQGEVSIPPLAHSMEYERQITETKSRFITFPKKVEVWAAYLGVE
ncbi:NB-ARC domain-containing protein [Citrus sinensis]|nr:NB-ARC domain-containing protein [Citrus sinensis]